MQHIFYKDWIGNFGDELNVPFFQEVSPSLVADNHNHLRFYGIGSLLNNTCGPIREAIVLGSGVGHGNPPLVDHSSVKFLGVRGPISAKICGLESDKVIGDPALLIPELKFYRETEFSLPNSVVLAPHHRTCEAWSIVDPSAYYTLNPSTDINIYITAIKQASLVLAESLHAAILAASFGVPFYWVLLSSPMNSLKWNDFMLSLDISTAIKHKLKIPNPRRARRLQLKVAKSLDFFPINIGARSSPYLSTEDQQNLSLSIAKLIHSCSPIVARKEMLLTRQNNIFSAINQLNNFLNNE
jgi:succinoglycan biosynthesis protein ExoV